MSAGVRSHKVRKEFLDWIEKGFSPTKAAKKTGNSVAFFNKWRTEDVNFAKDWDEAYESGSDTLEDVATVRAKRGSDSLLTTLLKARRPEKFREKSDINLKAQHDFGNIDEELERKIARALGQNPSNPTADS